ncbi:MAG TPA: outer membrane protein assembly factor BamA [Terriglobia bacterium]|nr:outer membrane protein assembly factor BamA [Terriglobia bacterium]
MTKSGQVRRSGVVSVYLALAVAAALIAPASLRAQNPQTPPGAPAAQPGANQQGGQQASPPKPATPPPSSQQPAQQANPPSPPPTGQQLQLEAPPIEKRVAPPKPPQGQAEAPKQVIIERIMFRGNRRIPGSTLQARIFSHPGDPYDKNALERDFLALWNTGFFDDIRLEVSDGEKGKIVTFFVREKKLVRSIDYKGMSTVSQSDVLDRFKEVKVPLTIDSQYDPVIVKRAEVVVQELLAEHGRQFATVRARTRNIPPNSVALTFIVVEGPKVKVGAIRFKGNSVFSSARLIRAMKLSRPFGAPPWFYWFHKTYDKDKVDADLEKVRELYQEHGYFFALPEEPTTRTVDTRRPLPLFFLGRGRGKRVDITIPIEEGAQYRLGKFTIRGNKLFKQQPLQRVIQLKTGDVFNLTRVRKSLDNYKKLYGEFGYINFVADPDIEPDRKKHIINLALDFDEGSQYFVHRIEFTGNTKTRDKVIRRELLVDEGNLFNTALWDYSVLRINQLGFFNRIKKEDYEITQNNKNHTVDIDLKVKEKGKNSIGFSGGVSGIAGNFVGINYATNNFLGLGETLSLEAQVGTFQKLYSFGFTEPYLFDRPITAGFTIFKSNYHFDQLRQLAISQNLNPATVSNPFTSNLFQNFQQNSTGFTVFASYPLRRHFARLGVTYSYSVSSVETFNASTQAFYSALTFGQFQGPNQLSGITTSQITSTYLYNTLNGELAPTRGKYVYAALQFSGSALGGNVNTIEPIIEAKYFHPINHGRNVLAFHFKGSTISGYGGRVPPPFSRFYLGGDYDIRGFDPYTISPAGFFPAIGQVCNRDNAGNIIPLIGSNGQPLVGQCGSTTSFPYYTLQFPGGDTMLLGNFEYRIPIAGPVTLAYFIDAGSAFVLRPNQLQLNLTSPGLTSIAQQFPNFPIPKQLNPLGTDNFRPRSSTGLELDVVLPVVNAPFRVYYAYDWLRLNQVVLPPQNLPSASLFPNQATYNDVLRFFAPILLRERHSLVGFTVARQF